MGTTSQVHKFPDMNICMKLVDKPSFAFLYKAGKKYLENIFSELEY